MNSMVILAASLYTLCYVCMRFIHRFTFNMRSLETQEKKSHERNILDTAIQALILLSAILLKTGLLCLDDMRDPSGIVPKSSIIDLTDNLSVSAGVFVNYGLYAATAGMLLVLLMFSISRARLTTRAEKARIEAEIPEGAVSIDKITQLYLHIAVITMYTWILSGYIAFKYTQ